MLKLWPGRNLDEEEEENGQKKYDCPLKGDIILLHFWLSKTNQMPAKFLSACLEYKRNMISYGVDPFA